MILRRILLPSLLLMLLLGGCGQEEAGIDAPTAGALGLAADATATTAAPAATLTPVPATATPLPPTPTATEEIPPSPSPTAVATALSLRTAADFGETRNPLTGETVEDPSTLERRPIAVKIPNHPPSYVRPQAGVNEADLVFEHMTEVEIPRFTAIFYSKAPEDVGPIRSARLIDLEIPAMYDAALAYAGSSIGVAQRLTDSDFRERVLRSNTPGYYRTGENIPTEHTLYGNPALWWDALAERGENRRPAFGNYMAFSEEPAAGGTPVAHIGLDYGQQERVDWHYEVENGRYWRESDGVPHYDRNTGEQLNFANVVIVFAHHQINYSICERQVEDKCYQFSTEIQIWGEGPAVIFRDGQMFEATWQRSERADMLTFVDQSGEPVPLAIGNTWFHTLPNGHTVETD